MRKEQKTRFSDEPDRTKFQPPPSKNVSFGPPEEKSNQPKFQPPQVSQAQQQILTQPQQPKPKQPPQEVKTKSEQNLEKLGITQIHPKPRQEYECRQQPYAKEIELQQQSLQPQLLDTQSKTSIHPSYEDQERKIQEVTSHLTSQLLKKHDQQYASENIRRRSSVKSANLNENLTCQLKHRRTSVPNWSSNRVNLTEKKNNNKNVERKKMVVDERKLWQEERRPSFKKHGGYIEFTGSDAEANWSDYENFDSEKDVCSNGSYQNFGYQESQEGLGGSGVVKYIEKDEYWVTQPDILSKRGSISQKGRISPYLLKDNVNNLSSPSVPASVVDSAQAHGKFFTVKDVRYSHFPLFNLTLYFCIIFILFSGLLLEQITKIFTETSCIHRSGSERSYRVPCHGSKHDLADASVHSHTPSRIRTQPSPPSTCRGSSKPCHDHGIKPSKSNFNSNLTHVLSTPDVAAIRPYYDSKTFDIYATEKRGKGQKNKGVMGGSGHLCTAVSEGELLDLSILPIFQKLLTERHKSRTGYGASIASCPNISIKCDIVEYL